MYADKITDSMRYALDETERRRRSKLPLMRNTILHRQQLKKKLEIQLVHMLTSKKMTLKIRKHLSLRK